MNLKEWEWEWELVNDYIENFNQHSLENKSTSKRLCVYDSFSRWYLLGGYCINLGLPHYV